MPTYKQIGRNEFPSANPERLGKTDVAYAFMNEMMQTLIVTVPLEDDTAEKVESVLRERVTRAESAGPKEVVI
jgi:hypothetical protein